MALSAISDDNDRMTHCYWGHPFNLTISLDSGNPTLHCGRFGSGVARGLRKAVSAVGASTEYYSHLYPGVPVLFFSARGRDIALSRQVRTYHPFHVDPTPGVPSLFCLS